MKYIRTKDELGIEKEDGTCCFRTWAANSNSPLKKDWLYADTIEELCDEFVAIIKHTNQFLTEEEIYHEQWYNFADLKSNLEERFDIQEYLNNHETLIAIYGATWTDKGLIYVAKMNEKGELELL